MSDCPTSHTCAPAYDTASKRHLVGFIDHLLADVRADIAVLERQAAAGGFLADAPFSTSQDPVAFVRLGAPG